MPFSSRLAYRVSAISVTAALASSSVSSLAQAQAGPTAPNTTAVSADTPSPAEDKVPAAHPPRTPSGPKQGAPTEAGGSEELEINSRSV